MTTLNSVIRKNQKVGMTTLKSVIKKRVKLKKRIPIGIVDAYKLIDQVSVKRTILVSPEFLLEGQTMRS